MSLRFLLYFFSKVFPYVFPDTFSGVFLTFYNPINITTIICLSLSHVTSSFPLCH
jgi:hypothetical protein